MVTFKKLNLFIYRPPYIVANIAEWTFMQEKNTKQNHSVPWK